MKRIPLLDNIEMEPATRKLYDGHIRRFYTFLTGKEVTEDNILSFLDHLDKKGRSRNYIRTCYRILKANVENWPIKRRLKFRVNPADIHQPVLKMDKQAEMLQWARQNGDLEGEAFLAIASIYGVRREELCRISNEDILEDATQLRVITSKNGETRIHLVPVEIQGILRKYEFKHVSLRYCSSVFKKMYLNGVKDQVERIGWHSIRRALVTEMLRTNLQRDVIGSFMRWKMANDVMNIPRMIAVYDHRAFNEIDKAVLDVHPFLGLWR